MKTIQNILINSKRDISSAWDEAVDAINETIERYETKIQELEYEIRELKSK